MPLQELARDSDYILIFYATLIRHAQSLKSKTNFGRTNELGAQKKVAKVQIYAIFAFYGQKDVGFAFIQLKCLK